MNSKYQCSICGIFCSGPESFQQHENSLKHKKKVSLHQDRPTNSTTEGTLADNNLQLFPCSTCNVQLRGFQSFQAHVNSLQHADMVRKTSSGSVTTQDPLKGTLEKTDIAEVNNPGSSLPFEGYNVWLGSFAHCVICKMQFSGPEQHQQHLAGKPHKKKLKLLGLNAEITQTENGSAKNDIPNNLTSLYLQCDTCQLPFSGPIPYQQHLVSEGHKKKMMQKELMAVKLSFDTVDGDKIMPFILNQEEAAGNDTTLCPNEKGSCIVSGDKQPFAKCTLCNMEFTGPEPYQLHIESVGHQEKIGIQHNSVNTVFKCDICNVPLSGPIPYNDHINSIKHKKKVQNLEFLKQLETNKSSGQDCTRSDKINGAPTGVNLEYYCEVCKLQVTGPEPYRQHIYGEPHKKKAANALCNVENANHFQNGLSEKNDLNHNLKTNNFYISKDLILCDGLENIGDVSLDNLNVQVFYPDDEIVFDIPIKKNVVSNL